MTYSPPTLIALGRYWTAQGGVNLGIVGDPAHVAKGISYHLGRDKLAAGAYSALTLRDKAGLTLAASAIDLGRLGGSFAKLREFSTWFVDQCRVNAPGTSDIREVIWSPDGKAVLRWDRERGAASAPRPGEADTSHLTHTHVSFYRDSEKRSKVEVFEPYFVTGHLPETSTKEAPVALTLVALVDAIAKYAGKADAHSVAAFGRNIALLRGRVITLQTSVSMLREAVAEPAFDVPSDYFKGGLSDDPYLVGGSPGNPDGVTFTPTIAVAWWTEVFAHGVNYSGVRPTLLPGSFVLTAEGIAAASLLAKTSLNMAPADYNPLNLEVFP